MIRRLIILLLIVGCDNPTDSNDNPLLGKWQVTETENWFFLIVDDYIEIKENKFITGKENVGMDSLGNPIFDYCFDDIIYDYADNNPNLILSYTQGETTADFHITYQLSNIQLNLQYLYRINNGDTTHCVDCYAIATTVNEIPEYDCPY